MCVYIYIYIFFFFFFFFFFALVHINNNKDKIKNGYIVIINLVMIIKKGIGWKELMSLGDFAFGTFRKL